MKKVIFYHHQEKDKKDRISDIKMKRFQIFKKNSKIKKILKKLLNNLVFNYKK
jgi:hypothetical protein